MIDVEELRPPWEALFLEKSTLEGKKCKHDLVTSILGTLNFLLRSTACS